MDQVQQHQSDAYRFPYHYIPQLKGKSFRSFRNWDWSLNYVSALRLVADKLLEIGTQCHLDVGCGDGALVHHLHALRPDLQLAGIDYDERAIRLAQVMTTDVELVCGDIRQQDWAGRFESASLVEVIEHIPPTELGSFLDGVHSALRPSGRLIVTVPHVNHPVQPHHYRHFDFALLRTVLSDRFSVDEIFGFERLTRAKGAIRRLTDNKLLFAEITPLNRMLLASELRFRTSSDRGCGRIFAVATAR